MMMGQNMQEQIQDYNSGMEPSNIKYDPTSQNVYHKQNLDMSTLMI